MLRTKRLGNVTVFDTWDSTGVYIPNTERLYVWDNDSAVMDYIVSDVSYEEATDLMAFLDVDGDERLERKYGFDDWDELFSSVGDRVSFMEVMVEIGVISSMSQAQCDVDDRKALVDIMSEGFDV